MTKYWFLYILAAYLLGQAVAGLLREQHNELTKEIEVAERLGWHNGFGRGVAASEQPREIQRTPTESLDLGIQTERPIRQYSASSD